MVSRQKSIYPHGRQGLRAGKAHERQGGGDNGEEMVYDDQAHMGIHYS